jgi:hypothetical protein
MELQKHGTWQFATFSVFPALKVDLNSVNAETCLLLHHDRVHGDAVIVVYDTGVLHRGAT